jgi:hypothetical protein
MFGMGTTKVASDARVLADLMAHHDDINAALAAYGATRLGHFQVWRNRVGLNEAAMAAEARTRGLR